MQTVVLFRGDAPGLGQAPVDVCALPARPPAGDIIEKMKGLRVGGALFNVPTAPLLLRGRFPSPIPHEEPYPRNIPIYLTPDQAAAETGFLTEQMQEALLPAFLRRLFSVAQPT